MKKIFVNADACAGCRYCEMNCSFYHEGKFNPESSRITVIKDDEFGLDFPIMCHQCDSCPCIKKCLVNAIEKTNSGVIKIIESKCIKCGQCVEACVFGAIKLHPETGVPIVCDLCDGNPICVKKCPTGAIAFLTSSNQARTQASRYIRSFHEEIFGRMKKDV